MSPGASRRQRPIRDARGYPVAVVAFGGNALLQPGDDGTVGQQLERAAEAAGWLVEFVRRGACLVIVHGNGPQVGQVMMQMEAAVDKVPPGSLDLAVAQTQGSMGYLLDLALRNRLHAEGLAGEPVTILSPVRVDADDPGFAEPTKPVGPFFERSSARVLIEQHGWQMQEERPHGWRKVVSSPRPVEILGIDAVRDALGAGRVLIAGGGGGIPVVREVDGTLRGVEAVIDKDRTASLLAREIEADLFLILTNVERVVRDFGTEREQPLPELDLDTARELLAEGQFPPGSMGPKVESAVDFVAATGRRVVITDIEHVERALEGEAGTSIVAQRAGVPLEAL